MFLFTRLHKFNTSPPPSMGPTLTRIHTQNDKGNQVFFCAGTISATPGVVPDMAGEAPIDVFKVLLDDAINQHACMTYMTRDDKIGRQCIEKNEQCL